MQTVGNFVVSTPAAGDSSNRIADTAFVTRAIASFTAFPTATVTGSLIYWSGTAWTTFAGNTSGTQFLQETSAGALSWAASAGTLVSIVAYSGSQTITIPATATKAFARMWGGTGGSGGIASAGSNTSSGSTGAAGYLEKYLTSLTAGSTLVYTQGGAGAAGTSGANAGGNGGASTLASGTQTISTLTANGSNGSSGATNGTDSAGTAGGTASGGDTNIPGPSGNYGYTTPNTSGPGIGAAIAPSNFFSQGAKGQIGLTNAAGNTGTVGGLTIFWFS